MILVRHATAASFLAAVGANLEEHEAENNLILGVALSLMDREAAGESLPAPTLLAHIVDQDVPVAALLMAASGALIVAPFGAGDRLGESAAESIVDAEETLTGVVAPDGLQPVPIGRG